MLRRRACLLTIKTRQIGTGFFGTLVLLMRMLSAPTRAQSASVDPYPDPNFPRETPDGCQASEARGRDASLGPRGETARARVSPSGAPIRNRSITQRQPDLYGALVGWCQRGKGGGLSPPKGAAPAPRPSPRSHLGLAYLSSAKAPAIDLRSTRVEEPSGHALGRAARLTLNRSLTRCRCGKGPR